MPETFSDYDSAAKMRDIVRTIVRSEINKERPETRVAEVVQINREDLIAEVRFTGDTGTVGARFGLSLIPRVEGVLVRVAGKQGNYYITEILNDTGENAAYEPVKTAYELGQLGGSDGVPPDEAPIVTATSAVGFITASWQEIDNLDPVTYSVYVGTGTPLVTDATTLYASTPATSIVITELPNGTAFTAGNTYYIKVIPYDPDGTGPVSNEISIVAEGLYIPVDYIDLPMLKTDVTDAINAPIGADRIIDGSVSTLELADGSVITAKISNLAVDNAKLGSLAVSTAKIADLAVSSLKVADAAIITAKVGDLAVNTAKIEDLAVNTAKIGDLSVNTAKIGLLAVGTAQIGNLAVTDAKIADLAVTNAKIQNLDAAKIDTGFLNAARIAAASITVSQLRVGDFSNLIGDTNDWTLYSGSMLVSTGTDATGPFVTHTNTSGANAFSQPSNSLISCLPGDEFEYSFRIYAAYSGGFTGSTYPYFHWLDGNMNYINQQTGAAVTQGTGYVVRSGTVGPAPSGAKYMRVIPYTQANGKCAIRDWYVRRKVTGGLIVDGAIDGKTITGAVVQTSATGVRAELSDNDTTGSLKFYANVSGEVPGKIVGASGGKVMYITCGSSSSATAASNMYMYPGTTTSRYILLDTGSVFVNNGQLTLGTITGTSTIPTVAASANVYVNSVGTLCKSTSSLRYKSGIAPLDTPVEKILALEPKVFLSISEHDEDNKMYPGFIAEEAQALGLHQWLEYDELGQPDSFSYVSWVAAQQKVIRYQQVLIEDLNNRLSTIEGIVTI